MREMQTLAVKTIKSYNSTGVKPWDCKIATTDLACQVGNLTKLVMQLSGERHKKGMSEAALKENIADELSDVICDALFIANELNIDLDIAFDAMLKSDAKKVAERTGH